MEDLMAKKIRKTQVQIAYLLDTWKDSPELRPFIEKLAEPNNDHKDLVSSPARHVAV